jgi:asparagine synthase (glutamine-hydrolysing)
MLAQRAAEDVRVVLVGEGGDELFGGYPTYLGSRLAGRYARWPAPVRRLIAAAVRALPPSDRKVTLGFLLKRFVDGAALAPGERHLLWTSNLPPAAARRARRRRGAAARARCLAARARRGAAPRSRDHARRGPAHQGGLARA